MTAQDCIEAEFLEWWKAEIGGMECPEPFVRSIAEAAWTACARQHAGREAAAHAEGERAAMARVMALVEVLKLALKRCGYCHGKGEWESSCRRCEDSGDDHVCDEKTYECKPCKEAIALLAAIDAPAEEKTETCGARYTPNPKLINPMPPGPCVLERSNHTHHRAADGTWWGSPPDVGDKPAPVAPASSVVKVRIAVGVGPGGWDAYGSSYIGNNEDAPARVRATRPSVAVVHWVEAEVPLPVSETVKGTVK
jgi:hypothetical protein